MLITNYYLPIYFQAVRHATPTMSGVYLLPAILSQIIFATVSGILGEKSVKATDPQTDIFQSLDWATICHGALLVQSSHPLARAC